MAEATSLTASKSTSPASFALPFSVVPTRFTPTSMTQAPFFTMSAVMAFGRPAATTRMSARRVCDATSFVPVWQIVTVAFAPFAFWSRMLAMGLPTMLDLPTTTTSAPSVFVPLRTISSWIPAGVQGRKSGLPITIFPTFTGWKASTSLSGRMARRIFPESTCFGRGSCTRIPWIALSALYLSTMARRSDSAMVDGRFSCTEWKPSSFAAFPFAVT